jgi:hypothetical protein
MPYPLTKMEATGIQYNSIAGFKNQWGWGSGVKLSTCELEMPHTNVHV